MSRALILLTLVAFTLQGFLTQTHIHASLPGAPVAVDIFDGIKAPSPDKVPSKNPDQNCPLCQQFASAGQFITPATAAVLLPSLSVSVIEVVAFVGDFAPPVTHSWRGRAPPQH
ncbi:MAG: hypothetical protein JO348_10705 [Alphaproteobacteria bacterium]|nr:hypothetical protein [Alphaproteobacteria bacterium]MBV9420232.1 hypothetical protein [Alphaproteobacteria bacterium]MBV9540397.1 hypothetical protein [Alphaproteobacteria bacterium]